MAAFSQVSSEASSSVWETQLAKKVEYLAELKRNTAFSARRKFDYDMAIVTAVPVELEAVKNGFANRQWETFQTPDDPNFYYRTIVEINGTPRKLVLAKTLEMGMPAASLLASMLIRNFTPAYLVMVGIAAGLQGETALGDVLVADPSFDYSSGKRVRDAKGTRLKPDPRQIRIDAELTAYFQHLSQDAKFASDTYAAWKAKRPENPPRLFVAPVGSGSSVVADKEVMTEIREHSRKTLGIDMETYGVYFAARNCPTPRPNVVSLKSVCDFADAEKGSDFQEYCSYVSVEYLKSLMRNVFT